MAKLGIFAGSFDPFTKGHLDIVEQSKSIFDRIIVGIGVSGTKKNLFDFDERKAMIEEVFKNDASIEVEFFSGLVVDFAKKHKADALIRGLRTETDFAYELPMALTNKKLMPGLETVFFPTASEYAFVSSSIVRELWYHGGKTSEFVTPEIQKYLLNKKRD